MTHGYHISKEPCSHVSYHLYGKTKAIWLWTLLYKYLLKRMCKEKLTKYHENIWLSEVTNSRKCFFYNEFKRELKCEKHLTGLDQAVGASLRYFLVRFRTCNQELPIEIGRYINVIKCERICILCDLNDTGDEFHYLCVQMLKKVLTNYWRKIV